MTIKELKKILNSTTEWDDAEVKVNHTHADGSGCSGSIEYVVVQHGIVWLGDNSDGHDYTTTTQKYYYHTLVADRIIAKYGEK